MAGVKYVSKIRVEPVEGKRYRRRLTAWYLFGRAGSASGVVREPQR